MEVKKLHRDCEAHSAENCDINDHDNLEPRTDDCGHFIPDGPGINAGTPDPAPFCPPDPMAPSSINGDQDPAHGPGLGPGIK